jgi:hypothetical protein
MYNCVREASGRTGASTSVGAFRRPFNANIKDAFSSVGRMLELYWTALGASGNKLAAAATRGLLSTLTVGTSGSGIANSATVCAALVMQTKKPNPNRATDTRQHAARRMETVLKMDSCRI